MPLCPRCGLAGLALLAVAFAGCDSNNPARDLEIVSGTYAIADLTFDPQANALDNVDVTERLNLAATRLRIYNDEDDEALFEVAYATGGIDRINLRVSASRGQVRLEAVDDNDIEDLEALLLPPTFTLRYDGEVASTISNTFARSGVNLQAFNPDRYQGLTSVSGSLSVSFER